MRGDLSAICRVLREKNRFLIACHENPEGDAIGSELALALALRKMGKTATVLNADPVPGNLLFLPGAGTVVFEEDAFEVRRGGRRGLRRDGATGRVARDCRKCPLLVNIDHHRTNGDLGEFSLVDPEAAATGLLIHRVLSAMEYEIDVDVAINIYVAILTDTGSFHYGSSSPEAFEVAGEMVRRGVDPWAVAEQVYETQSALRLRLLGRVLDSLEVSAGGRVACITTMRSDLLEFAAGKDALEGFINYPRSIVGTEVAVSIREEAEDLFV